MMCLPGVTEIISFTPHYGDPFTEEEVEEEVEETEEEENGYRED